jgi:hypothetical protein
VFDKLVSLGGNRVYRKAVWLYLFLLIFEGALRRWVFPSLATPLLIVRDPIVIWLVLVGFHKGWLKNGFVIAMIIVSSISFLMTLLVGHQNLYTALFGWRIYLYYFPFIFVLGHILTKDDILKMGKFILYLSIPMTVLIILQFYSPQSAWVNRGVGGDMEGAGFGGALGYFRPPGTFTFTSGYIDYQLLVGCFLFYYLLANKSLKRKFQINSVLLWVMLGCYLITIPYSISRTHFFQTAVILFFVVIAGFLIKQYSKWVLYIVIMGGLAVSILFSFNLLGKSLDAFTTRFEGANKSEGGMTKGVIGNRFLGSTLRAFNTDLPFFGYGIGLGTRAGTELAGTRTIYVKFNSEEEWSRTTGECGLLLGMLILVIRVLFAISVIRQSYKLLNNKRELLPWLLTAGIVIMIPIWQWGQVSNLGFAVVIAGLGVAAVKTSIVTKK